MRFIGPEDVARLAPYADLIEALRQAFRDDYEAPARHQYGISPATTLLLMPAWSPAFTGLKTVTVKADNAARGLSTVQASYLLIDNDTGTPVAVLDGTELTRRRTAAASALAADYLARPDAQAMVMIGAGALARHFVRAHACVRPIAQVSVFSRTLAHAESVAHDLRTDGFEARAVSDPGAAVEKADLVSCATGATEPILKGAWLKPGTHVDLAGAFKPVMREADAEAVARSRVYVDTREGAQAEAGDLIQAQAEGKFDFARIAGDLFDLCRDRVQARRSDEDITLFKSCGAAIEDLAAAAMIYARA